jgi:hypothetical protein
MKQIPILSDIVVQVHLAGAVAILHPVLFSEGDNYCCLLGPNPQEGIMGCGDTPVSAIADWENRLKEHLSTAGNDDQIVQHVKALVQLLQVPDANQNIVDKLKFQPLKKC